MAKQNPYVTPLRIFHITAICNLASISDVRDLNKIDWPLFYELPRLDGYCQYWFSTMAKPRYVLRQETRQAEFLVHKKFPLKLVTRVGVYNEEKQAAVSRIFEHSRANLQVEVKPEWYF